MAIPSYEGRRIISISTAVLQWVDTRLIYVAAVARGSPIVTVFCFKHNENKFHSLYNINVCTGIENVDNLEANDNQSYMELPAEAKFSLDAEFLAVTCFNGAVLLLRMPPIVDPMQVEAKGPTPTPEDPSKGTPAPAEVKPDAMNVPMGINN